MANGIELKTLTVGYNSPIIEGIDFSVNPGEIVALIGPNGAGKSTVLKTITRQLKRLEGTVLIEGLDERNMSEHDLSKRLSMVLTEKIHPELFSCFDMVATGRYPYTGRLGLLTEEDKKKVNEAIELVGAQEVVDKDFMKISDGQRQRVMLARALCQEPKILILDEPTSFLDIQYKIDILSVIRRMARERNIAVLMSIHELEFVPAVADRVVATTNGEVLTAGTPEAVITGENIEAIYHMEKGMGEKIVKGLLAYSDCMKGIICQK